MTEITSTFSLLKKQVQQTLTNLGYKIPTPVQKEVIPLFLEGSDLIVQAQTGTGKTAAFALPIIEKIDINSKKPEALVLAPTRELAIQVTEAFNEYSDKMPINATAIYGGQSYTIQKQALKKNPKIIVATPGRLVDMLKQKNLKLDAIKFLILDESDEMLKMGFLEEVRWIIEQLPENKQTGLFSATLPKKVLDIANSYLSKPKKIIIKPKVEEAAQIKQELIILKQVSKLDVLYRLLAKSGKVGTIIFVKTKQESMELAEKLTKKSYSASPINGDMNQAARERAIEKLKSGKFDILVATDVAARGIDVDRIEHVINYDMPFDVDSYVHRIGRTGRGGRTGLATLFVTPREKGLLRDIERRFGQLEEVEPPTRSELNKKQLDNLSDSINRVIDKSKRLDAFYDWAEEIIEQGNLSNKQIIAALGYLSLQDSFFDDTKDSNHKPEKPKPSKSYSKKPKYSKKNTKPRKKTRRDS